jgi:hypothetical protein
MKKRFQKEEGPPTPAALRYFRSLLIRSLARAPAYFFFFAGAFLAAFLAAFLVAFFIE